MKNFFIILFSKFLRVCMNILGKKGGNLIGKIALKLNPNILQSFKINSPIIAVTATNGKTMTNNALGSVFRTAGKKVISNSEGNNMEAGIVSTLLKNCSLSGKINADFLIFEVDESYVPIIFKKIKLDTLIVLDFFRDQLDRNGEVESLILKIDNFLKTFDGNLILNNDDPNVVRLGKSNPDNSKVYYFSVDRYKFASDEMQEAGEGKFCPFCKARLEYEYYQYSHIGKFKCPNCDYGNNELYKVGKNVDLENQSFEVDDIVYNIKSNSIYIIYNFVAVIACASLYDIDTKYVQDALSKFELNNGRLEHLTIHDVPTIVNLAKNPTGANVSLRLLNEDDDEKELLFVLNDNTADGFDVSWIWDINFDNLNNVKKIVTSGSRAYDIAIRIKTSGFENEIKPYLNLHEAIEELYSNNTKKYVIANYTALQPTRNELLKFN